MSFAPFVPPQPGLSAFNCPRCGAFADQEWSNLSHYLGGWRPFRDLKRATCAHCNESTIWLADSMIDPQGSGVPQPNPDLPDLIKRDYREAGSIVSLSPRGAAALLRLAIEKLVSHVAGEGDDLSAQIGHLVSKGMPKRIQQGMDIVRVIGNEAVHPGVIDLSDDEPTARALFDIINMVAEAMITEPRRVEEMYERLPDTKRKGIDDRDSKGES